MSRLLLPDPDRAGLGVAGLGAFLWSLRSGQYDDLDGAAERILFDDDVPLREPGKPQGLNLCWQCGHRTRMPGRSMMIAAPMQRGAACAMRAAMRPGGRMLS